MQQSLERGSRSMGSHRRLGVRATYILLVLKSSLWETVDFSRLDLLSGKTQRLSSAPLNGYLFIFTLILFYTHGAQIGRPPTQIQPILQLQMPIGASTPRWQLHRLLPQDSNAGSLDIVYNIWNTHLNSRDKREWDLRAYFRAINTLGAEGKKILR